MACDVTKIYEVYEKSSDKRFHSLQQFTRKTVFWSRRVPTHFHMLLVLWYWYWTLRKSVTWYEKVLKHFEYCTNWKDFIKYLDAYFSGRNMSVKRCRCYWGGIRKLLCAWGVTMKTGCCTERESWYIEPQNTRFFSHANEAEDLFGLHTAKTCYYRG